MDLAPFLAEVGGFNDVAATPCDPKELEEEMAAVSADAKGPPAAGEALVRAPPDPPRGCCCCCCWVEGVDEDAGVAEAAAAAAAIVTVPAHIGC